MNTAVAAAAVAVAVAQRHSGTAAQPQRQRQRARSRAILLPPLLLLPLTEIKTGALILTAPIPSRQSCSTG